MLPALPPWLRVLAMDQRGHGEADKPPSGYGLSNFAEDMKEFLEALDIGVAVLVGSSSGGYVAQQVAISWPHLVSALVLVGSPRTLQGRPAFADEVDQLTDPIDRDWVRDSLEWFTFFHPVPDWYLSQRITDGVRMPARVWREALAGLSSALPPTDFGQISAPTLIIWGDRDELIPLEQQKALSSAIPGSRLSIYPETGHLVLWEEPEKVAADLAAFITEQQKLR